MIALSRTVVPATVKGAEVTVTVENHPHREAYLSAMSNAPTAVTIIAVGGRHGPVAQTVSAISSVSADPPTLLACVNRRSPLLQAAASVRHFSVSVLAARQTGVVGLSVEAPGLADVPGRVARVDVVGLHSRQWARSRGEDDGESECGFGEHVFLLLRKSLAHFCIRNFDLASEVGACDAHNTHRRGR